MAQTESQIESDEVKRVGTHITCQCGACTENVNCNMSSGQCHFCKPARTKIYKMQKAGMNDSGIIASFVKQYGDRIFRARPELVLLGCSLSRRSAPGVVADLAGPAPHARHQPPAARRRRRTRDR